MHYDDSQPTLVMEHLRTRGSITPQDALKLYGCMRLASVIHTLKKRGNLIRTNMVTERVPVKRGWIAMMMHGKYRETRDVTYAKYTLETADTHE